MKTKIFNFQKIYLDLLERYFTSSIRVKVRVIFILFPKLKIFVFIMVTLFHPTILYYTLLRQLTKQKKTTQNLTKP